MCIKVFPVIDPVATGNNIRQLRLERGLTVREMQDYFGFEEPRAIYKWQSGETLPSVDNLYALGSLFEVPMEKILVQKNIHSSSSRSIPAAQIFFISSLFIVKCEGKSKTVFVYVPDHQLCLRCITFSVHAISKSQRDYCSRLFGIRQASKSTSTF